MTDEAMQEALSILIDELPDLSGNLFKVGEYFDMRGHEQPTLRDRMAIAALSKREAWNFEANMQNFTE